MRLGLALILTGFVGASGVAHGACTSPVGKAGQQVYDTNSNNMVFCNGTNWVSMSGGASTGGTGTTPAGSTNDVQYNNGGLMAADTGVFTYASNILRATTVSTTNAYGSTASYTALYVGGAQVTGGSGGTDQIVSSTNAKMVAGNGGTVSFTTGGVAGTAYVDTAGRLVTPGVSATTNRTSVTTLYASGNVGIGNTAPSYPLDVTGNARIVGTLYGNGGTGSYGAITIDGSKGGWAGINFKSSGSNYKTWMMYNSNYSGVYNTADNGWDWYFNGSTLAAGTVPVANVSGSPASAAGNVSSQSCSPNVVGGSGLYQSGATAVMDWTTMYYCVVTYFSDERLKKDIEPYPAALGLAGIENLRLVSYRWKDKAWDKRDGRKFGLIAQDVEKIFPQAVTVLTDSMTIVTSQGKEIIQDPKKIDFRVLVVPLVKAVQELKAMIDSRQDEIKTVQTTHKDLAAAREDDLAGITALEREIKMLAGVQR